MTDFLCEFLKQTDRVKDLSAVVDQGGKRRTGYAELNDISGRLAKWLKRKGIKKEDVVAICVPRGMEFVATRIAVMKAGAAWVGTEALMGKERIDYIIKDSNASLVMDEESFREALKEDPLPVSDWADPDPHDLAFIYYTSGSTGNPKGVAEEYGIYRYIMDSTRRAIDKWDFLDYANVAPETYIGGIDLMIGILQAGSTLHLIPLELVRNPSGLLSYFKEQNVTASCMPPTLIKVLESIGGLNLKVLHVAGEIATDLYIERFTVRNAYGPTEIAYLPFFFDIDRPYPVTPIGTPDKNTEVILINENGEKDMHEGMLCIHLPYFRGYLHDKERTELINVDGKPYFKTGDYTSLDAAGNYTILGRMDDMVKINGNRIEPAEVEAALKKVLKTDFAAVKAWERNGSRFLCAYLTGKLNTDAAQMAEKLKSLLPSYMIPSCYVSIDEIPLNENGKVNKLALPEPDEELLFAPFAPAENEIQKRLIELFSLVLAVKPERLGIDDDFFLLGGDSLSAIRLVAEANEKELTVPLIYRERTVRNISRALKELSDTAGGTDKDQTKKAVSSLKNEPLPLTAEQNYYLSQELKYPGRMLYNLPLILYFKPETDDERLKKAVLDAFNAHPSLLCVITDTGSGYRLRYCPGNLPALITEEVSEADLKEAGKNFPKPFYFDGSPLFHIRLLHTPERLALFTEVHHIICDGTSCRILAEDILSLYEGKKVSFDPFFEVLSDRLSYQGSDELKKDLEYYENNFKGEYSKLLNPDLPGSENIRQTITHTLSFSAKSALSAAKGLHLSATGFFMLCTALAVSAYNSADRVMLSVIYDGRQDIKTVRSVGLLIRDYPVPFDFNKDDTVSRAARSLSARIREIMLHGSFSPFINDGERELCFIHQGVLQEMPESDILTGITFPDIEGAPAEGSVEFNVFDGEEGSFLEVNYDAGLYRKESINKFILIFEKICLLLLDKGSGLIKTREIIDEAKK